MNQPNLPHVSDTTSSFNVSSLHNEHELVVANENIRYQRKGENLCFDVPGGMLLLLQQMVYNGNSSTTRRLIAPNKNKKYPEGVINSGNCISDLVPANTVAPILAFATKDGE